MKGELRWANGHPGCLEGLYAQRICPNGHESALEGDLTIETGNFRL